MSLGAKGLKKDKICLFLHILNGTSMFQSKIVARYTCKFSEGVGLNVVWQSMSLYSQTNCINMV